MRILFCNVSYPGRFGRIPSDLAADPTNEVMFLSFHPKKDNASSGIIHARLNLNRDRGRMLRGDDTFVMEWEKMFSLGKQALQTFLHIRDSGFIPDMIFVSFFDGPALFLRHIFPQAFIVSYFNGFRSKLADDGKLLAVMDLQRAMAAQSDLYFVRSEVQKNSFPPVLHPVIHVWPPYVDTALFHPMPRDLSLFFPHEAPNSDKELVTGHMKGTGRSQKELMWVIFDLLECRPHCLAALTFESEASKKQWQQVIYALPKHVRQRIFLAGGLDIERYHHLLCCSSVYVFPEYSNSPLQGMLETMSCETLLMTPVQEGADFLFLPEKTMLAYPEEGREKQREAICRVLDHLEEYDSVRQKGREVIAKKCDERVVLGEHLDFVMKEYEKFTRLRRV